MPFLRKIAALFRKEKLDAEMAEEMRLHLERRVEENVASGMSPDDARYAALRKFGGVEQAKELARDQRGFVWLQQLTQDLRYACRQLARAPGFTAVVVLTLALGIGTTTAIYSVVDSVILNPIPGANSDRLVQIGQWIQFSNRPNPEYAGQTPPSLLALQGIERDFFVETAWTDGLQLDQKGEEFSTLVFGSAVSGNFFSVFGARPLLGRTFTTAEEIPIEQHLPAKDAVIVISHDWWKSDFGSDRNVLGRVVELSGKRLTIVGVMPEHFQFPSSGSKFWLPAEPVRPQPRSVSVGNIKFFARLKPGFGEAQTQAMLDAVAKRLLQDFPDNDRSYGEYWRRTPMGLRLWCRPLREMLLGRTYTVRYDELQRTLLGFLAAIGFVLAIVCANVANLTLARTERRQHELAVRAALGAGRGRLMRQLLTENLLLAGLGGVAGMAVTGWAINILAAFNTMPRLRPIELDGRVLGIALVVSLLTGLTFGLLPAWQAGRARVNEALTQGGQISTASHQGRRLRGALVVLEVMMAVVLLSGAGLMIRSVVQLLRVDPGFDPVNLMAVRPDFTGRAHGANEMETRNVFTAQLHERLANLPGVSAVGVFKDNYQDEKFVPEGRAETVLLNGAHCGLEQSDYFRTARIPLVAGRYLERGDIGQKLGTVIVNETLAELCWPGQSAVGKTFRAVDRRGQPTYTVVGVVRDSRISSFDEQVRPMFYRPYQEASLVGSALTFVVRTQNDPANLTSAIRREIRAVNPDMRRPWISVYRQTLYDATAAQRTYRNYLAVFAGTGLFLAALGIYGVLAYSVERRTREIGIRMAIGAERRHVMNMVMGEGARLIGAGVVVGLIASFWLTRLLQKQLFNVSPHDPLVLAAVVGVLAVVALLACWLPARRAAGVNPIEALRAE